MLIVSQDKTKILNFDNIEVIGIGNPLENDDGKFQILVDTTNDNEFSIAKYGTEERAKEVLNEIMENYKNWEYTKMGKLIIGKVVCDAIYTMPEE